MELIRAVYESLMKAMIRFWDNRFIKSNDIEYYRMEIEKLQIANKQLLDHITQPTSNPQSDEKEVDWQPANSYKPWSQKKKELEEESRRKALKLATEAREAIARAKSTEELEHELLNGTD